MSQKFAQKSSAQKSSAQKSFAPKSFARRVVSDGRTASPRPAGAGDHARLFAQFAETLAGLTAGAGAVRTRERRSA